MNRIRLGIWAACLVLAMGLTGAYAAEGPGMKVVGIPEVADPPPGVNGDLDRMERVPGWVKEEGAAHVTFGRDKWTGDADLSGSVALGWRNEFLYVAVRVKDNVVVQPYAGENLWQGDHVILLLDVPRQVGAKQKGKVFQIGLSPGNLKPGAAATAPEVYEWTTHAGAIQGARVGAIKTADGYQIEAAIPWGALGIQKPERGLRIGYDIMLSDADSQADPKQAKVMSLLTSPWDLRNPDRLVEGVLAGSDGKVDPAWIKSPFELVRSDINVAPKSTVKVPVGQKIDSKPIKELIVRARIDYPHIAGGNPVLQVLLNGKVLEFDRIRNRLKRIDLGSSEMASNVTGGTWFLFYAPDFKPIPDSSGYAPRDIDPFELRFDVSDLWKAGGGNVVELTDNSTIDHPVIAEVGVSEELSPKMEPPKLKPAPTGPIPTFAPITEAKPNYSYRQLAGGAIEVKLGNQQWVIESRFSTTTPGWAALEQQRAGTSEWKSLSLDQNGLLGVARDFKLKRTITRHDDHLQVVDRLTNTSSADLPLMFRHQAKVDRKSGHLFIAGLPAPQAKLTSNNGASPTTLMVWDKSGLGFVSEDDITRAQGENFADNDEIGIRDDRLVIQPDKTVELEFSVYPLDSGDPYAFINRIRRNWDVNFTIQGSEVMVTHYGTSMNLAMSDERLKDYLLNKSAYYAIGGGAPFNFEGLPPGPTPIIEGAIKMMHRIRAVRPDIVQLVYFHCYVGYQDPRDLTEHVVQVEKKLFKQDEVQRPDGSAADYSNPMWPIFLPTEGSPWAKAQEKLIDFRIKTTGVDGIYWDEIPYSAYKYDYNPAHWDGASADINATTHRITRKITNVTLASQPWRLKLAKSIMAKYPLMGNSGPHTRSFTQLHFPRFVETGLFSNIVNCQLFTPIALADNLSERTEVDAYKDMVRGLDYGTVYYWYPPNVDGVYPTLTSYMFPVTPVNLGHGYLIAKERILTNRSGYFGWGDKSDFETVVFDERGHRTDKIQIPHVEKEGKTFAQVRIPEGYSVAIIRK
jgi:hypothetical protein